MVKNGRYFNCLVCGTRFYRKLYLIKRGYNKFCSRRCAGIYKRNGQAYKCLTCGKVYYLSASRSRAHEGYCSRECSPRRKLFKDRTKACEWCGESYDVQWRGGLEVRRFCSRECYYQHKRRNRRAIVCDNCGAEVMRRLSRVEHSNKHFCNDACTRQWLVGENSPLWRGGSAKHRGSSWSSQRRAARDRDNYTCQGCGVTEQRLGETLDVHHIRPFRLFYNDIVANDLDNLISLCYKCHLVAEKEFRDKEKRGLVKGATRIEDCINQIIVGDCEKVMAEIPSENIDLFITSPPFNLGNVYRAGNRRYGLYNDNMPEREYQEWQLRILSECYRLLKPGGSMFYNHKNRIRDGATITPYSWLLKSPFIVKQELVWFNGGKNFDKCRFYPMSERMYWLVKGVDTSFRNVLNHADVFNRAEWQPVGTKVFRTRAFPLQLVMDIFACFPEDILICDPFMGSGTVALGAIKSNNRYIGIEINQEFCDMAEERLAQDARQLSLF